jgi:hypothetical protein
VDGHEARFAELGASDREEASPEVDIEAIERKRFAEPKTSGGKESEERGVGLPTQSEI